MSRDMLLDSLSAILRRPDDLVQNISNDIDGRMPASLPRVGVKFVDDLGKQLDEGVVHQLEIINIGLVVYYNVSVEKTDCYFS